MKKIIILATIVLLGLGCSTPNPAPVDSTADKPASAESDQPVENQEKPTTEAPAPAIDTPPLPQDAPIYTRKQGESNDTFVHRVAMTHYNNMLGMRMHDVIEGMMAGVDKSLLAFYFPEEVSATKSYKGFVLVPLNVQGEHAFLPMPDMDMGFYTGIESVFFANADDDSAKEIVVLMSQMSGAGQIAGESMMYESAVFDWTGEKFKFKQDVSKLIGNLYPASEVKKQLKSLGF